MELSATGKVILGMIAARPRSGYEIKQLVDSSARFFWAASYGQIYPELKRLEKEGLITGADSSRGARQRTIYKLTAEGKRAAREWIDRPPETFEMRDEGLLELFFAESIHAARTPEIARERAAQSPEKAGVLRSLHEQIDGGGGDGGPGCQPRFGLADCPPIRNRNERMGGRVVRARRRGSGKREVVMFNALASLAQNRGKRVVIVAVVFFVVAGAARRSVADKLDPYGADDPSTESVIADDSLEAAGFRDASVIVLIEGHLPDRPGRRSSGSP